MKRPKALVHDLLEYECAHTRVCLVVRGRAVVPDPVPLVVGSSTWPVGTRFLVLGSKKTSAGFETLDFRDFEPMEYVGQFSNLDGTLALFKQGRKPANAFFAYHATEWGLMWGTDLCAGRVIAMDKVVTLDAQPGAL